MKKLAPTERENENMQLMPSEFMLKYSQINEINKKLPKIYKLELVDNMMKSDLRYESKRHRTNLNESNEFSKTRKYNREIESNYENSSFSDKISSLKKKTISRKSNLIKLDDSELSQLEKMERIFRDVIKIHLTDIDKEMSSYLTQVELNFKTSKYNKAQEFVLEMSNTFKTLLNLYSYDGDKTEKINAIVKQFENQVKNNQEISEDTKKSKKIASRIKKKLISQQNTSVIKNVHKVMTMQEKAILGNNIRKLNSEQLKGILTIILENFPADNKKKYFEFDIETLSNVKLRELEKYVNFCVRSDKKVSLSQKISREEKKTNENQNFNQLKNDLEEKHSIKKKNESYNNFEINENSDSEDDDDDDDDKFSKSDDSVQLSNNS